MWLSFTVFAQRLTFVTEVCVVASLPAHARRHICVCVFVLLSQRRGNCIDQICERCELGTENIEPIAILS